MKVYDNFLPSKEHISLKTELEHSMFPWYYIPNQANDDGHFYLCHVFYFDYQYKTHYADVLKNLIYKINPTGLINIRANCLLNRFKQLESNWHIDNYHSKDMNYKTAIYYVNTNNGITEFKTGEKIESVENQLIVFDCKKEHRALSQTDVDRRIVININYFE
tara:strand:- start:485 stop:970 length:486 start_codon:yes stop_codon:yes gene_type:complete